MPVGTRLSGHVKELGPGFLVRRLLPSVARQGVGPFVFFDHFGPVEVEPDAEADVRPHPHIGLATVTFLFEGAVLHRDSLGSVQRIEPGAVNWMTAGRGIVHSERTPDELRGRSRRMHGLQLWLALPEAEEEAEPAFVHHPAATLPTWEGEGARVRVLVGALRREGVELRSPVRPFSPTVYLDVALAPGGRFVLDGEGRELAVYPVEGELEVDGERLEVGTMGVLDGARGEVRGRGRFVVIGGDPLSGRRVMWWNFVSSRAERVRRAAADWEADRFPPVPGESERIPLPTTRLPQG